MVLVVVGLQTRDRWAGWHGLFWDRWARWQGQVLQATYQIISRMGDQKSVACAGQLGRFVTVGAGWRDRLNDRAVDWQLVGWRLGLLVDRWACWLGRLGTVGPDDAVNWRL